MQNESLLSTLNRGLDVLEAFSVSEPQFQLGTLSERTGIAKPTLRRLLTNLVARGYVIQDPETRLYRLGLRCWQLGTASIGGLDWQTMLRPHLDRLAKETLEQVTVWFYDAGEVVCVQRAESSHRVRSSTQIGTREPAHLLAAGMCFLASLDPEVVDADLRRLSVTEEELRELHVRLDDVRTHGYAVSEGLRWDDAYAVSAPVRDHTGETTIAMAVAGPGSRLDPATIRRYASMVRETANTASAELGGPGAVTANPIGPVRETSEHDSV